MLAARLFVIFGTEGREKRRQNPWQRAWRLPAISSPAMPRQMPKGFSATKTN
jgi:hypothetical protein